MLFAQSAVNAVTLSEGSGKSEVDVALAAIPALVALVVVYLGFVIQKRLAYRSERRMIFADCVAAHQVSWRAFDKWCGLVGEPGAEAARALFFEADNHALMRGFDARMVANKQGQRLIKIMTQAIPLTTDVPELERIERYKVGGICGADLLLIGRDQLSPTVHPWRRWSTHLQVRHDLDVIEARPWVTLRVRLPAEAILDMTIDEAAEVIGRGQL